MLNVGSGHAIILWHLPGAARASLILTRCREALLDILNACFTHSPLPCLPPGCAQALVLDEADRILDMGFSATLNAIISNIPRQRQTLLFSATQTKSVKDLARLSLKVGRQLARTIRPGRAAVPLRLCATSPPPGACLPCTADPSTCGPQVGACRIFWGLAKRSMHLLHCPAVSLSLQDPEYVSVHAEAAAPTPVKLQQARAVPAFGRACCHAATHGCRLLLRLGLCRGRDTAAPQAAPSPRLPATPLTGLHGV